MHPSQERKKIRDDAQQRRHMEDTRNSPKRFSGNLKPPSSVGSEDAPILTHSDRKLVSHVLRHPRNLISNRLSPRPDHEFQLNDTKPAVGIEGELVIFDEVVCELTVVEAGYSTAG